MMRRFRSLRTKLLGVILLTTLVALIVALLAMIGYDLRLYHQIWISDMRAQAELLARTTAPALEFDDPKVAQENLGLLRVRPQIRAAAIYNARGGQFAKYSVSAAESPIPNLPGTDGEQIDGRDLIVFKRIVNNGEILGTVYLRADYQLYDRLLGYAGIGALVVTAAMLVAYLLCIQLGQIVTRPILAIADVAREIETRRDYSRRADKTSDDEVGSLAESFNSMLAEIERRASERDAADQTLALEITERRHSEEEVVRLNAQLEERVRERTAQLEASNDQLVSAKKDAENANQAKSSFLSSMSHELRTPLNAILGFGQILASETLPSTPAQRKDFTSQILKAGRHLLSLINEILDLAQIESGKVTLSLEPVSVAELLLDCQAMTEPLGTQRNVRMIFPENCELHVFADRIRLKQVLLNLLSNAIKYNRENGTVVVDAVQATSERIRISVQDTGMGLHAEQLGALFQAFNRLGQEQGAEEGTGIGLVLTKRLVELMGGEIGVSSTVGMGTIFWVELKSCLATPRMSSDEIAKISSTVEDPQDTASCPMVLYVEDNPANLKLVEELLGFRTDLRLVSAPDGKLGVDLARAHVPRVVLLDINLPGLNGGDVLKILRNDPRTADIPVIAITANAMPRDIAKGLATGFFRYLTKPINIEELNEAIDSALTRTAGRDTRG